MTTSGSRRTARRAGGPGPLLDPAAVEAIEAHLSERERRRDEIAEAARRLRRRAQGAMAAVHEGRPSPGEIAGIREEARALARRVHGEARADAGLAHDALQEAIEAALLDAIARGARLPGPAELGVEPEEFLDGLGDLVGEVRRLALDRLTAGDEAGARSRLREMESVYRTLLRFETTRGILALKPKQDQARALLERTRGDVTMASVIARARPARRRRGKG
jgi:translin